MDTHCIGYILKYDMLFLYDPFKIITTDGLLNTLKLHGRTCTMVDAAHGFTKYEKVKLTALFVRSLRGEGIAVANSRQTTIEIYKRFIAHLIEWMGPIETAIFMANMDKKESVGIVRKQYWRRSSLSVARANSLDHQQIKNYWKLSRKWILAERSTLRRWCNTWLKKGPVRNVLVYVLWVWMAVKTDRVGIVLWGKWRAQDQYDSVILP